MSKRSQEKRKARAKEKKVARRRMMGTSPLSRLAGTAEELCECWMSASPDTRMISLAVIRPVRGGQAATAHFLIDMDCIGLKDAFYRLDTSASELREMLRERSRMTDMRLTRLTLEETRALVASAICWTREHPFFRMPADVERCLKIMGGAGDIAAADTSEFGVDGKLFYVGRRVDLAPRLVGMTVEEFIERPDVTYEFHMGDESFAEEDDEEDDLDAEWDDAYEEDEEEEDVDPAELDAFAQSIHEMQDRIKQRMLEGVRKWCIKHAVIPHPELEAVVDMSLAASLEGLNAEKKEEAVEKATQAHSTLESFESEEKIAAMREASKQFQAYVDTFGSQEEFLKAMADDEPPQ